MPLIFCGHTHSKIKHLDALFAVFMWSSTFTFTNFCGILFPQPEETTLTFTHAVLKSDSAAAQLKACGVCLLDVDCSPLSGSEAPAKLSYSGRQYHAPCANFWVNCVDSMLPALKLPELL